MLFLLDSHSWIKDTVSQDLDDKWEEKLETNIAKNKKGLSTEEKVREQNRIRQLAFKARGYMPKDYRSYCLVAAHLVKNAHRYYKDEDVKNEEIAEQKQAFKLDPKTEKETACKEVNKKLREIRTLKRQNRIREQQELVAELKVNYGTYRAIKELSGLPLKTLHEWCAKPKDREHKGTSRANLKRQEFINFLMQDTITYCHPCKKYAGKRFMLHTLNEVYARYQSQTQFQTHGLISKTTMRVYKPKNIFLSGSTPITQCLCDTCENCELIRKALLAAGVKGVPSNKYECLDATFCRIREGKFGTEYKFPPLKCIQRTCEDCGRHKLAEALFESNAELLKTNKRMTWHRWQTIDGKTVPKKCEIKDSLKAGLNEFLDVIESISNHLFRANWHRNVFQYIRSHLMTGHVLQVLDFAMNFTNRYQDEVQSAYYNCTQTTIHGTINFFKCLNEGCSEIVTLALVHISEDTHHDSFLSRAAMNMTFRYLVELGIPLDLIIQFCDNCASQYKSRRPFVEIARCALELIRVYFGEKHGKSHADGLFGRLKAWMTYKVKSRHFVITSAYDFFKICREYYQTPILKGCCQHYRVEFEFIRPSDIRRHQDSDLQEAVPKTHQIYSVRNTSEPLRLKVRHVPCLCPPCVSMVGECLNSSHTDAWREVKLIPQKGANKMKYQKRKRPDAAVRESRQIAVNNELSYNESESESDGDVSEITFEVEEEKETAQKKKSRNKNPKNAEGNGKEKSEKGRKSGKSVTENVTESQDGERMKNCTWVNQNEESTEDDFVPHTILEENEDIEIIDICSNNSKEFEMEARNFQISSGSVTAHQLLNRNVPESVMWPSILSALESCHDFAALEILVSELNASMPPLKPRRIAYFSEGDVNDTVAQKDIPQDGPRMLKAVRTYGDGNCLCRALSKAFYNTDEMHLELRARIVIEGVTNKWKYLNDDCLERGASFTHGNADLPTVFTTFSDFYTPGQRITDDTILAIYCLEVHSCAKVGAYMGLWQLAQASTVLQTPVHTIYPVRGDCSIRNDMHRIFFPVEYPTLADDTPIVIMWTGIREGGVPTHFVPLLSCE